MKNLICFFILFSSILYSQDYGTLELYYDTPTHKPVYAFGHMQTVFDTTISWSSYSWYCDLELNSKQWVQYWPLNKFGLGLEIEIIKTYITRNDPLYIIPRIGIQYRVW